MNTKTPSLMAHVSIGTNNFERSVNFYDRVMPKIGARRIYEVPEVDAIAYGRDYPEFWVNTPGNDKPAETANGVHFAFMASSKSEVHEFWHEAIAAGAMPDGEPGPRPHYGKEYYGCFMRDPDGHKIEVMFWENDA